MTGGRDSVGWCIKGFCGSACSFEHRELCVKWCCISASYLKKQLKTHSFKKAKGSTVDKDSDQELVYYLSPLLDYLLMYIFNSYLIDSCGA